MQECFSKPRSAARDSGAAVAALLLATAGCARPGATAERQAASPIAAAAPAAAATAAVREGPPGDRRRPAIAVLDVAFYGKRANSIEPGDSAVAGVSTGRMWGVLRDAGTLELIDSARVAATAAAIAPAGIACNTNVSCARGVGERLGARWVVMAKVSKTSNLIWYFSGQLIDVATGKLLMDDEFELKGIRDDMVPRGATSLARRVVRVTQREVAAATPASPAR